MKKGKVQRLGSFLKENNYLHACFGNFCVLLFIVQLLLGCTIFGQDSIKSQAIRPTEIWAKKPLVRSVYPPYPLMAGFLLVKEANEGDPFAQHELGIRYIMGNGFPADTAVGISWLKKAVTSNIPAAHFNYGIMLTNGTGVNWNPFEAYLHFKFAAESGMPEGQYMLSTFYIDNYVVNRNIANAFYWLRLSANSGFLPAKNLISELEKSGYTAPDDTSGQIPNKADKETRDQQTTIFDSGLAIDFLNFEKDSSSNKKEDLLVNLLHKKSLDDIKEFVGCVIVEKNDSIDSVKSQMIIENAAKNGSPEAIFIIANQNFAGNNNVIEVIEEYLKALRLGYNKAFFNINKIITTKNFKDELTKKVSKKDPSALYVISQLRLGNLMFEITFEQAVDYLKTAAFKKNVNALNELGLSYYSGKYVDKDKTAAIALWNDAIKLGDNEAKQRIILTKMIDGYETVLVDDVMYLKFEEENGSVLACPALGYAYERGIFVPCKKNLAMQYYRKGAHRGNQYAFTLLKRLYDEIRPNDEDFIIYNQE
ncbi:MAG: tetratricopeptide repeat protein [bacterium]